MSRWTAPSDYDYDDHQPSHARCLTRGCENRVTFDFDAFCSSCLMQQAHDRALKHEVRTAMARNYFGGSHDDAA